MHREKEYARVRVEDTLRSVAVVNVPIDDRYVLDLLIFVLPRTFAATATLLNMQNPIVLSAVA